MRKRMPRRVHDRGARPRFFTRVVRFVRALFSSGRGGGEWDDDREGGLGVREPRRPLYPALSGAVALEAPPDETRDVRAVGDENVS
jgi:hypothetical protein